MVTKKSFLIGFDLRKTKLEVFMLDDSTDY